MKRGFSKHLYFRVDGNETIGMGHVMRCLSIADAATEMGMICFFITADTRVHSVIAHRGYPTYTLNSSWDNLDSELEFLIKLIFEKEISCLFVDSYFVTVNYMRTLSKFTRLVYIDDLFKERFECATLINYNCYASGMGYENAYPSPGPQLLLGLRYVPLRSEFSQLPPFRCKETVHDILITTGGTDSINIAGMLTTRLTCELQHLVRLHVVVGVYNNNFRLLKELSEKDSCIVLHTNVKQMSNLMRECDLAVSAGGSTLYELCACGIPTIVFLMADNQKYAYAEMTKKIMLAGGNALIDTQGCISTITEQIHNILGAQAYRQTISRRMQSMVNGKGAYAVIHELFGSA